MSYRRRLRAERRLSRLPMPMPAAMLSDNHKTHTSINLPVLNCRPAVPGAAGEGWRGGFSKSPPRRPQLWRILLGSALPRETAWGAAWPKAYLVGLGRG